MESTNGDTNIETINSLGNQDDPSLSPRPENVSRTTPSSSSENGLAVEKRTVATPLRSKRSKLSQMALMIQDLKSIKDENLSRTEEGEYDIFGKSVALQLGKLSEEHAIVAQEQIQSILTQCKLADIKAKKQTTSSCPFQHYSQPQFFPSMQQLQNSQTQVPQWENIQFPSSQHNQSSLPSSTLSSPPYCPPPGVSPSDTNTSSSLGLLNANDDFEIVEEDVPASSNIIEIAFNNA